VVNVFGRELGLVVWTGNPRKLEGVGDLARRGVRREPAARPATRTFTEAALAEARIERSAVVGYRDEVSTHRAVGLGPEGRGRRRGRDPPWPGAELGFLQRLSASTSWSRRRPSSAAGQASSSHPVGTVPAGVERLARHDWYARPRPAR
jgi:hypothetical protein